MLNKILKSILILSVLTVNAFSLDIEVTDSWINAGETKTMTADNTYFLDGFVYVEDGATLNIEAGTVIKGKPGQGENATALIIAKGGKIYANGTAKDPIIFTSVADDVNDPADIPYTQQGLWGGIIILGKSITNEVNGVGQIEGIPAEEPRGEYGGGDNIDVNDNSGVLRYVSIRHGGSNIGLDNEINGLTMGAVGDGTIIDHVEVYANQDDGFEFFGGTVNTRYLVAAFCGDDSFDWDVGFAGKGQFWFTIQAEDDGNNGAECDGGKPDDAMPYAKPILSNLTFIGSGKNSGRTKSRGMYLRDNTGGEIYNSIFMDFGSILLDVEDLGDKVDSEERMRTGDLKFENNIIWDIADNTIDGMVPDVGGDNPYAQDFVRDYLKNVDNNVLLGNPMIRSIDREAGVNGLDPRPETDSPANDSENVKTMEDSWFLDAPFVGAFGTNNFWVQGWTFLDEAGFLAEDDVEPGVVNVYDADINAGDEVVWTSDNVYVLNGLVFVEEGATLTIEPGTVIKAQPGQGVNASALIIAKDAKIFAEGTLDKPIIFTSIADDVTVQDDIPTTQQGLWGGIIVLGNAPTNFVGGGQIEGIPDEEPRGAYGGDVVDDNSGIIRFVSIRHGGSNIGQDNEINGLTLGGVGNGTTVEYVEVFANQDDGFEFFGGTVNSRYLVAAFCGDDSFDWDLGFSGKGQFWFTIQAEDDGNNGAECDGGKPDDAEPFATPTIVNATFIGSGKESGRTKSRGVHLRDNSGGYWYNSIFTDFGSILVDVEELGDKVDSEERMRNGELVFNGNIMWDIADNSIAGMVPDVGGDNPYTQEFVRTHLADNLNTIVDPEISISREAGSKMLDPRPSAESPALVGDNIMAYGDIDDDWFLEAPFAGAFGSNNLWIKGWTFLDKAGYVTDGDSDPETVQVYDNTINPGDDYVFETGNTYILNGFVFVEAGATLTIQPGAVVKGLPGQGVNASALIVCKDAKIFANGTPDNPIIMTSSIDDVTVQDDIPATQQGLWGGLIVLGNAPLNFVGGGQIEGIPEEEPRGAYGGDDANDNSGVLKYISIRHGGSNIGQDNEINGLTLGGVGAGTVIDHIEVFANQDDGIEFFGGTAEIKYAVVAFSGDDAFDYDLGYSGKGQFWFSIQAEDDGNNAGEFDGGKPDDATPYAIPTIANATFIGSGKESGRTKSRGFHIRDNAGGKFYNLIFVDYFGAGLDIEDLGDKVDSEERLRQGDLVMKNVIWHDFAGGNDADHVAPDVGGDNPYSQEFVRAMINNASNDHSFDNPELASVSREANGQLDPRPNYKDTGAAWQNAAPNLPDGFFDDVNYVGAFGEDNWLTGWTYMDELGYLGDFWDETSSIENDVQTGSNDFYAYPNPASISSDIKFVLHKSGHVNLSVYNQMGELVTVLGNEFKAAGTYKSTWNVSSVATGMYFVKLETEYGTFTQKVIVK